MNTLIKTFGNEKRWVNYKLEKREGKTTKVPYYSHTKKASSTDSLTWKTYDESEKLLSEFDGVGIVFTPEATLLGIDIDHCINPKTKKIEHEKKDIIADLILEADTYTEYSPSGTGLHLFLKITAPLELKGNKKAPFELYNKGRYFTVTFKSYGKERDVRIVTPEEAEKILSILDYPWKEEDEAIILHPFVATNIIHDNVILQKMFSSKKGAKVKSLYDGDTSDYKGDDSSADLALCSHLAFWTGKNATQMERLWLSSPLGQRKKTQSRLDYRTRTINAAIKSCKEVYETTSMKVAEVEKETPELDLMYVQGKDGKIYIQNTENICRILRHHPDFKDKFRYDNFKNIFEVYSKKNSLWRGIEDNDAVIVQTGISILFPCFAKVGKDMVYDAIIKVSKENMIDSAVDYVSSLVWDKKKRLDSWLSHVYGAPNDEYHRAVGSNWMKGLVKRLIEPGCKFDYVLVLEGEQGTGKSTSLYTLGGNWHVETAMSTENKDFFMQFSGKAIVEFSEGETFSRTEVKRMKAIITMQVDKYRPPYERASKDFPRRCVFAMTTNQTEYLKDETGNRRWLPVSVVKQKVDIEWLKENREQLFAEAYYRTAVLKEKIYEFPEEETKKQQEARRINDPNTDIIENWFFNELTQEKKNEGITAHDAYKVIHGSFPSKVISKYDEMIIGDIFKRILGLEKKRNRRAGNRSWRWYQKGFEVKEEKETEVDEEVKKVFGW